MALAYGILKSRLPSEGPGTPRNVAFVDIGQSCTQVRSIRSITGLDILHRYIASIFFTAWTSMAHAVHQTMRCLKQSSSSQGGLCSSASLTR